MIDSVMYNGCSICINLNNFFTKISRLRSQIPIGACPSGDFCPPDQFLLLHSEKFSKYATE